MKYAIGQTLYWVPGHHRAPYSVTITTIGRVWMTLSNHEKVTIAGLTVGGDFRSGTCYPSEQVYRDTVLVAKAWRNLRNGMGYVPAPGVTLEQIHEAAKILGVKL